MTVCWNESKETNIVFSLFRFSFWKISTYQLFSIFYNTRVLSSFSVPFRSPFCSKSGPLLVPFLNILGPLLKWAQWVYTQTMKIIHPCKLCEGHRWFCWFWAKLEGRVQPRGADFVAVSVDQCGTYYHSTDNIRTTSQDQHSWGVSWDTWSSKRQLVWHPRCGRVHPRTWWYPHLSKIEKELKGGGQVKNW